MNRALVAVVAALLVSAGVVGGVLDGSATGTQADEQRPAIDGASVDGPAPSTTADVPESSDDRHYMAGSERTRRLELNGEARSETLTGAWSLGAQLYAGDSVLESNYETSAVTNRVERLSGDRKERVITEYLQDLEDRIVALRATERRAVGAYARGEAPATNLSRALVRSHVEAKVLQLQLERLSRLSDSDSNEGFASALQFRLNTFRSPLRERLAATLRGDGEDVRISLRATETGYVIGAIDDGEFLREALRYDNRRPDGPKAITTGDKLDDRQSAVYNVTTSFGVQRAGPQNAGAYLGRVVYDFSDAEIRGYFDGGTGDVFFERNTYRLEDMDRTEAINTTNESVRLRVERTFFDGPIRVTVVDAETGEPIDTTVRIAGNQVGGTGDDGTLWLVEPANPYAVAVTVDGTVVSDTVVNN